MTKQQKYAKITQTPQSEVLRCRVIKRGVIQMATSKKILVEPRLGAYHIYFDENLYTVDPNRISDAALSNFAQGLCTGTDTSDLEVGHIIVKYNPVRIGVEKVVLAVENIVEIIKGSAQ